MSLVRRISNLFARSKVGQEIDAELKSHIAMRIEDNIAAGMTPEEAQRDALVRFGNPAVLKERVTAADAALVLDSIRQDVQYGIHGLLKSPGFTILLRLRSEAAIDCAFSSAPAFPWRTDARVIEPLRG
jgi:hypothetical protein